MGFIYRAVSVLQKLADITGTLIEPVNVREIRRQRLLQFRSEMIQPIHAIHVIVHHHIHIALAVPDVLTVQHTGIAVSVKENTTEWIILVPHFLIATCQEREMRSASATAVTRRHQIRALRQSTEQDGILPVFNHRHLHHLLRAEQVAEVVIRLMNINLIVKTMKQVIQHVQN